MALYAWHGSKRRSTLILLAAMAWLALLGGCSKGDGAVSGTSAPPQPPVPTSRTADDLFRQGNQFYSQGNLAAAEQAYRQALALDPNRSDVYTNLGVTYYMMGRLDDAIDSYLAGLKLAPDDAELNYLLGAAYLQQSRLDEAREALLKANRADPNLGEPYYGLGVLYKLEGKREEAIAAFEKFLEIGPAQDPRAIEEAKRELQELRAGQ